MDLAANGCLSNLGGVLAHPQGELVGEEEMVKSLCWSGSGDVG